MGSEQINPNIASHEPELNLLIRDQALEEPLYKSLFRGLDEFFFPKKLPPLKLESKPEPVKEIWGFYDNGKNGALGSTGVHILIIGLIALSYVAFKRAVTPVVAPKATVTLVDPSDLPVLKPSKTQVGGGGGGGDRDVLQASKGKLPKLSMQQITPPVVVVRNEHPKLAVEPTIVVPPQVQLASNSMPNLGDPMAHAVLPSNGTGAGGGIGSGGGGGVGSGKGPGLVPAKAEDWRRYFPRRRRSISSARDLCARAGVFRRSAQGEISGCMYAGPDRRSGRTPQQYPRDQQPGDGPG